MKFLLLSLILNIGYPINDKNSEGLPLPTQEAFHKSKAKYRLLAGGFATGKTTSLCLEVIKELLRFPNNYGVLGRKDLGELKSTTLKEFFDILPKELIANHNRTDRVIRVVNNSELYYMNLDDSREAVEKIKSLNLGFVAIDQLEEINEPIFLAFQGRLRRQNSSRNFFATCNPQGHDWLWSRFKNNPPSKEYQLFEAITLENKYLPQDYVDELLQYPEKWVKRYVYCSWDDFEGLVYSEYQDRNNKIPVYEPSATDAITIVMDYGFRNPTSIGFYATDYDGVSRRFAEYYQTGKLIEEISAEIKKYQGWENFYKLADPSIWNVQRDGKSVGHEFMANGIYFQRADNDIMQGVDRVNTMLKAKKLLICENCVSWFDEQGNYKWKEVKPGQIKNEYEAPVKHNDHAMDETRYFVNYIYKPIKKEPELKTERPRFYTSDYQGDEFSRFD